MLTAKIVWKNTPPDMLSMRNSGRTSRTAMSAALKNQTMDTITGNKGLIKQETSAIADSKRQNFQFRASRATARSNAAASSEPIVAPRAAVSAAEKEMRMPRARLELATKVL